MGHQEGSCSLKKLPLVSEQHDRFLAKVLRTSILLTITFTLSDRIDAQALQTESKSSLPDAPSSLDGPHRSTTWNGSADGEHIRLRDLPGRFVSDELHIITSPARIRRGDMEWLLPITAATGVSLATDTYVMQNVVSRNSDLNSKSGTASDVLLGSAIGVPLLLFGGGVTTHNQRSREAGFLAEEAIVDSYVLDEAIKYAMLRERPVENNARGRFFVGGAASDPSFISGHSIMAWSSAAVLASEYNRPWQQVGIYSLASGMSIARVLAQKHFPTDVLLGSAAGYLIGKYVYRAHHSVVKHVH